MIRPAVVLDAATLLGEALTALEGLDPGSDVVVRRGEWDHTYWYHFHVSDFLDRAGSGELAAQPIRHALQLHETGAAPVIGAAGARRGESGIVVEGDTVLGVALGGPGQPTRGNGLGPALPAEGNGHGAEPGTEEPFDAYPRLECPDTVAPETGFDLIIGLGKTQQAGIAGARMLLAAAPETFDLEVQVSAQGFQAPEGIRRKLTVHRDDFEKDEATIKLVAPALPADTTAQRRLLEVEYAYQGMPVGRAWKEILISPSTDDRIPEGTARTGSLPVMPAPGSAVDLTVTILAGTDPGKVVWTFTSPHPVPLPDQQVEYRFPASAQTFAQQEVKDVARADGSGLVKNQITGIAREVAGLMPPQFWTVLAAVWGVVGSAPSLLLVSSDPYIPWELAAMESDFIDPALLDPKRPALLGAQLRMGRWVPAGPASPRGVTRPALPPATSVELKRMAVVVGDYAAQSGMRPLPMAMEEGKALANTYPSFWMRATEYEMILLINNRLEERGELVQVQAVHIACHGAVDEDNARYNGIVLSDNQLRLSEVMVEGSEIGRATQPFVFLNACQLGYASEMLGDYGGMAGAFLKEGARGFVAPLWSVNDQVAHDLAIDFYKMTIEEKRPVGEVMRDLRSRYDPSADKPSSTPVAYLFYGHPDMKLDLEV